MPIAPHGTVTFLFTDVEGSTRLWERWPEAMRVALATHDRVMRSVIETNEGYVFSTAGDAFAVAFWTPEAGAHAALVAERELAHEAWPDPVVVRVRMGLHTGTADERDGDYFGPTVNRAARIMSAGHGGQILVSLATEELVRDRLGDDVALVDLGEHPLSGLARPEHVFELSEPGMTGRFPPLRTTKATPGNLPVSATSFVGREAEVARLVEDLAERRLVTLTGVGGVGKTRLALEAARAAAGSYPDGVWLCELAPVSDPDSVPHAVATTLKVRPQAGISIHDSVVDALRGRNLLLIVDNCEHVLGSAAEVVRRVNASCPTVTVLATSREPVGVDGEWVRGVPSLAGEDSVELFRHRAAAVDAAPSPTPADTELIATICERLDGIPLAIELAAARAVAMTPADLADRLHDRFRLLRRGRRGGVERHQTLRATVQWSYELLAEDERLVFNRLATFAGGCDLGAAEAVCSGRAIERDDVDDLVAALVDKSMVVADRTGPRTRIRLLETLRQFGEEQLAGTCEDDAVRHRHLDHYVQMARKACEQVKGTAYAAGMAAFEADWDNLRAALQWAVATGDTTNATALLEGPFMFALWRQRHELGAWADQVAELDGAGPSAYGIAAKFAWLGGDHERAIQLARTGVDRATPETYAGLRICTDSLGRALWFSGQRPEGWATMQAFATMFDPVQEPFDAAWALLALTGFAQREEPPRLAGLISRAREIAEPLANPALETLIGLASGWDAEHTGAYDDALAHLQRARVLADRAGDRFIGGFVYNSIAMLAATTGVADATSALRDALDYLYDTRNWANLWGCVESIALYWAGPEQAEVAGVLLGYLEAHGLRHNGPGYLGDVYTQKRVDVVAALQAEEATRASMARGAAMDRTEVVEYALHQLASAIPREVQTRAWSE